MVAMNIRSTGVWLLLLLGTCSVSGAEDDLLRSPVPFRDAKGKWGFCTPPKTPPKGSGWRAGYDLGKGTVVIPAQYKWVGYFREGMARVTRAGTFPDTGKIIEDARWGFINRGGKEIAAPAFLEAEDFRNGYARVKSAAGWGLIDRMGQIVLPTQYRYVDGVFRSGRILVRDASGWGFCDGKGKEVIRARYRIASSFRGGMARVMKGKNLAWIDPAGREYARGKYEKSADFSEGLAAFRRGGKWGYLDKTMREVLPPRWEKAGRFSQGLAAVRIKNKCGYLDQTGKLVIPAKYAFAGFFDAHGMAMVYEGEHYLPVTRSGNSEQGYQFINKKGENIFGRGYNMAYGFDETGTCSVYTENGWQRLHRDGRLEKERGPIGQFVSTIQMIRSRPDWRSNEHLELIGWFWMEPHDAVTKFVP